MDIVARCAVLTPATNHDGVARGSRACSRPEFVTHNVSDHGDQLIGTVHILPRWHCAKAVMHAVPHELGLVAARLKLRSFAGIGLRAMAMGAHVLPERHALADNLLVL